MRPIFAFCLLISLLPFSYAQSTKLSPWQYFEYQMGSKFTRHDRVLEYLRYVSTDNPSILFKKYGKTYEGRDLCIMIISSKSNLKNIDKLRQNNLSITLGDDKSEITNAPSIVWLSYNVHGNESVSTEAALETIYQLLDPNNTNTQKWLENTIVIIDPCLNPDGRDRYVNFYQQAMSAEPYLENHTIEHHEPWPSGRTNHYFFDLNRDWAWQSQIETKYRIAEYKNWMPHVHVDFHEMGINSPYYFAPAAEPMHERITPFQKELQVEIGKNNAQHFDKNGWLYFTKEIFDLFYPSYGDTYPTFNGAVGMTYEQGGSGRAGLSVLNQAGDTLTLVDRIQHHVSTGMSTIEVASKQRTTIVQKFRQYFKEALEADKYPYDYYCIKNTNPEKTDAFTKLLQSNGINIKYSKGNSNSLQGFQFLKQATNKVNLEVNDVIIQAAQPAGTLLHILFEIDPKLKDSLSYDLTAWSLPLAWDLDVYGIKGALPPVAIEKAPSRPELFQDDALAYICIWDSHADAKFLSALLKKDIKVQYNETPVVLNGNKIPIGSLILHKGLNLNQKTTFGKTIKNISKEYGVSLIPIHTSFAENGPDLGSDQMHLIEKPIVAMIKSDGVDGNAFGEVWHYFDHQLKYPLHLINRDDLNSFFEKNYNTLILPDGNYGFLFEDKNKEELKKWIKKGGKLIAMESSISQLANTKDFGIKITENTDKEEKSAKKSEFSPDPFCSRLRNGISGEASGAVLRAKLDITHPMAFGMSSEYFTLKKSTAIYKPLEQGWNVGFIPKNKYIVGGFVGSLVKEKLAETLVFGCEEYGKGNIIYMVDNPIFRAFWENGKLIFANSLFMVGN